MTFSIIVPVYNVQKYIRECIESVLQQTYRDYELILVDDGSSDNSPQICDDYAKSSLCVKVIHTENRGASAARNLGIKLSSGQYLCFLDADDYWDSDTVLDSIFQVIQDEPDIVRIGTKNIRESDNQVISDTKFNVEKYQSLTDREVIFNLVADGALKISAFSVSIRKRFLTDHNLFFKEGIRVEDLDWAIRLYACTPSWGYLKDNVYVSRRGRVGSVTNTIGKSHLCDYLEVIQDSISLVNGLEEECRYPLMSYLMYQTTILIGLVSNSNALDKQSVRYFDAEIEKICHSYYRDNTLDKRVKLASIVFRISGYKGLKLVLALYLKHRGR